MRQFSRIVLGSKTLHLDFLPAARGVPMSAMREYRPKVRIIDRIHRPDAMKRLNARLKEHPELLAQRNVELAERVKIKGEKNLRRLRKRQYLAAVQDFHNTVDCSPDAVFDHPICIDIATRFDKPLHEVVRDINGGDRASPELTRATARTPPAPP